MSKPTAYSGNIKPDTWKVRKEWAVLNLPRPPAAFKEAERIEHVLPRLAKRLGLGASEPVGLIVSSNWAKIAGTSIAAHSKPGDIADGVLTVMAQSGVWIAEIRRLANGILLQKVNKFLENSKVRVKEIKVIPMA